MQVAVHKDFGRRGIAANLTTLLVQNIKNAGYKVTYAQCTSQYSKKAMVKAGFKIEKTLAYKDYSFNKSIFCCFGNKTVTPFTHATEEQPDASLVVMRFD